VVVDQVHPQEIAIRGRSLQRQHLLQQLQLQLQLVFFNDSFTLFKKGLP
jgi:hypothetical protein